MPYLHIRVLGHKKVGKANFIAKALDVEESTVTTDLHGRVDVQGQTVLLHVTQRVVEEAALMSRAIQSQAVKDWDKTSPERVDGAVILYDVTNERSVEALPTVLRSYGKAGIPSLLVSSKPETNAGPTQINSDLFGQKAKLWDDGLMVFQTSFLSGDNSKKCLDILLQDILHKQSLEESADDDAEHRETGSHSRPGTAPPRSAPNPSGALPQRHVRTESDYSSSSARESIASGTAAEPLSPTTTQTTEPKLPRPKLAADAAQAQLRAKSKGNGMAHERDQRSIFDHAGAIHDDSDQSITDSVNINEDESDNRDAAILSTQQTYPHHEASFNDLIERLAKPVESTVDVKFIDRFLAFYRMFGTAQRLLEGLLRRCIEAAMASQGEDQQIRVEHIFRVLSVWIKRFPGDFAAIQTADMLDRFLSSFEDSHEGLRLALNDVVETDDTHWGVTDDCDSPAAPSTRKGSSHSSRPPSQPQDPQHSKTQSKQVDETFIFKSNALTLKARGPSDDTSSLTSARTKEKVSEIAQRQAVFLVPTMRDELTKDRWRHFLEIPERDVAEELTRIDWIMFTAVKPRELIRDITVSHHSRHLFPNLVNVSRMVEHFNHVAYWVANMMLLRDKPKHRAQMWLKLARVARELRKLNNYNSLGALVAGMESVAIHRLGATRALVSEADQRDFMRLQILMNISRGHFSYRMAWDNTTGARLPFLPLHRRDLVVADQGSQTFLTREEDGKPTRKINWTKFDIMGSILTDIQRAQATNHPNYRGSEAVRSLLLNTKIIKDDDDLHARSVAVEPVASARGGAGATAKRKLQPWLTRYGLNSETK